MARGTWRAWWAMAAACFLLAGCGRHTVRPTFPPDPLLSNKRPIEGKTARVDTPQGFTGEPLTPGLPAAGLATAPPAYRSLAQVSTRTEERTAPTQ